jgi:hypothetical protein
LASIGFSLGRTVWRGLVLVAIFAAPAYAETVSIACKANTALNAPAMTIVYEGEAEGTLTIAAPFGEMRLPATKEDREGTDEKGQPISATGIRAGGPATVQMPEKASIEACVRTAFEDVPDIAGSNHHGRYAPKRR